MSEGNSEIATSQGCTRTDVLVVETGVGRRSFRAILNDLSPTNEYARVITEKGKRDSATRQAINSSKPRINHVPLSSRAARTRWVRVIIIIIMIPSVLDWHITRIRTLTSGTWVDPTHHLE